MEGVGIVHDESEFDSDDVRLEKMMPREKNYP
jgi:serine/threonine kinase 32